MPYEKDSRQKAFQKYFGTENQCREYLFRCRWPRGFVCPRCGSTECCFLSNGIIQCSDCHYQASVTAGTVMHRSHIPLTKWFRAIYLVQTRGEELTAIALQEELKLTYKTAWYLLARIRSVSDKDPADRLLLFPELGSAYFAGPPAIKKHRRPAERTEVFAPEQRPLSAPVYEQKQAGAT